MKAILFPRFALGVYNREPSEATTLLVFLTNEDQLEIIKSRIFV